MQFILNESQTILLCISSCPPYPVYNYNARNKQTNSYHGSLHYIRKSNISQAKTKLSRQCNLDFFFLQMQGAVLV